MKYFTKNWHESIQKTIVYRSSEVEKQIEKAEYDYQDHYKKFEPFFPECVKKFNNDDFNMHDCLIICIDFIGKGFCMEIDSSSGFCDVDKLTFVNAQILEMDGCLNGGTWLYDEVYLHQGRKDRYEMHILFHAYSEEPELGEMIIVFDKIIIEGNWAQE